MPHRWLLLLCAGFLLCGNRIDPTSARPPPDRRLVFAVSPPFHGNALLSELLGTCPTIVAKYCDAPSMGGDLHHMASQQGLTKTYKQRQAAKLPALEASIKQIPEGFGFVDTCPNFATGWHDIVIRNLASRHPITILLIRDFLPHALGRLQLRRASISPWHVNNISAIYKHQFGQGSFFPIYTQHSRFSSTLPLRKWTDASDDELLMGYLVDFEARRQTFGPARRR